MENKAKKSEKPCVTGKLSGDPQYNYPKDTSQLILYNLLEVKLYATSKLQPRTQLRLGLVCGIV